MDPHPKWKDYLHWQMIRFLIMTIVKSGFVENESQGILESDNDPVLELSNDSPEVLCLLLYTLFYIYKIYLFLPNLPGEIITTR